MHRRSVLTGMFGLAALTALPRISSAATSTPEASTVSGEPLSLEITLTDTGFEIAPTLAAGRYQVTVTNAGESAESHFALGKIPDRITDTQYAAFLQAQDDTADLHFDEIAFVGVPDWPAPGGSTSGVIDLEPGRYFLVDPISGREPVTLRVEGEFAQTADPPSDLTVELREMTISLPDHPLPSAPARWKITNTGGMSHEMALLPVSPDLTADQFEHTLQVLMSLPEDATPPPDLPEFTYQPVAAIGILAPQHTSWLDLHLAPGRYVAVCMIPFGTGYPHVMDGMYKFIDVE